MDMIQEDLVIHSYRCNKCDRYFLPHVKPRAKENGDLEGYLHVPDKCPYKDCRAKDWFLKKGQRKRKYKKNWSLHMKIRQKEAKLKGFSNVEEQANATRQER